MKKVFLFAALFGGVVAMSSCSSSECCSLNGLEICESDLPSGYDSWDEYKEAVDTLGGSCE